jgi:hypothetical protein
VVVIVVVVVGVVLESEVEPVPSSMTMRAVSAGVAPLVRSALQLRACTVTWSPASTLDGDELPWLTIRVLEVTVIGAGWVAPMYAFPCEFVDVTVTIKVNGSVGLAPGATATVPCSTTVILGLQLSPVVDGLVPLPGWDAGGAARAVDAVNAAAPKTSNSTFSNFFSFMSRASWVSKVDTPPFGPSG